MNGSHADVLHKGRRMLMAVYELALATITAGVNKSFVSVQRGATFRWMLNNITCFFPLLLQRFCAGWMFFPSVSSD